MTILLILIVLIIVFIICKPLILPYNKRGFNYKGIHKNGTKYDDFGFDVNGFDTDGYNRNGYDKKGFDKQGFNKDGYNVHGKDHKGRYNRLYDISTYYNSEYSQDGFLDPRRYPIALTNLASERIQERIANGKDLSEYKIVHDAYCYGKSSRQIKRTSAALVKDIEERHDNGIVLIYNGFIYIFSEENVLITVYKNEKIPL